MTADLPQLRMRHSLQRLPALRELPESFALRTAAAADAAGIARVLHAAFEEPWTTEGVHQALLDHPEVPVTFVIEEAGEVVATASYQIQSHPDPAAGWVHWVGVHPSAQGLALGEVVCRRVLGEAAGRNRSCALLTTDDPRLAAIKTYLRLGFEPDPWHPSHPDRWTAIFEALEKSRR